MNYSYNIVRNKILQTIPALNVLFLELNFNQLLKQMYYEKPKIKN